jgi:hypothetical protein
MESSEACPGQFNLVATHVINIPMHLMFNLMSLAASWTPRSWRSTMQRGCSTHLKGFTMPWPYLLLSCFLSYWTATIAWSHIFSEAADIIHSASANLGKAVFNFSQNLDTWFHKIQHSLAVSANLNIQLLTQQITLMWCQLRTEWGAIQHMPHASHRRAFILEMEGHGLGATNCCSKPSLFMAWGSPTWERQWLGMTWL